MGAPEARRTPGTPAAVLDWGRDGAARAARRGDVLVVVDVLSFSSAVATAVHAGAGIVPCAWGDDPAAVASAHGAVAAVRRREVPALGRYSLSPLTYEDAPRGSRIVVASPNGATCVGHAREVPVLLVGSLLNARATANAAATASARTGRPVTVLACGERWPEPGADGPLRFAVEDLLGAGAVLSGLADLGLSADAAAAVAAFRDAAPDLARRLLGCESGRELAELGFGGDVTHAARLDAYEEPAALEQGVLVAARS